MLFQSFLYITLLLQTAAAAGYINAAYYPSWKTYDGHTPEVLPVTSLTHIHYAFADVSANGTVIPHDDYGDYQQLHAGDVSAPGNNAYGNVKQLYLAKMKNRQLKVILSIGGGEPVQATNFRAAIASAAARTRFINSAMKLMFDWGMDGLDLDFEFPLSTAQGENFYTLVKQLRADMDTKAASLGQTYHYQLSAAVPVNSAQYKLFPLSKLNQRLDYFNLMAYDYVGEWNPLAGHNSNLYADKANPKGTPFNTDAAVSGYINAGVSANKIVMGIPLYGRYFTKTAGLGKTYSQTGTLPFNQIPKKGAKVYERASEGALVTYDSATKEIVTLDGGFTAKLKAAYAKKRAMAGMFFWETSGDKTGSSSLIKISQQSLASLDNTQNQLSYPTSEFDNIRAGMAPAKVVSRVFRRFYNY